MNSQDVYEVIEKKYPSQLFAENFGMGVGISIDAATQIIEAYRQANKAGEITRGYFNGSLESMASLRETRDLISSRTGIDPHKVLVWVTLIEQDITVDDYDAYSYILGIEEQPGIVGTLFDSASELVSEGVSNLFSRGPVIMLAIAGAALYFFTNKRSR